MSVSAAVILPSLLTPIFIRILPPGAGPVASNTDVRSITNLTGRPPDFFDRSAAIGAR